MAAAVIVIMVCGYAGVFGPSIALAARVARSGLAWREPKTSVRLRGYRYAASWAVDRYAGRPDMQARIGNADETALLRAYLDQRRSR